MRTLNKLDRNKRQKKDERIAWATFLILIICGIIGVNRTQSDLTAFKQELWPEAHHFEDIGYEKLLVKNDQDEALGCITTSTYDGFGGPLKVAVALNNQGQIHSLTVIEHRESPSWFNRVVKNNFYGRMEGKSFVDPLQLTNDVDAITGATYTTNAITVATKDATLQGAKDILNKNVEPYITKKRLKIGLPEISLLLLFIMTLISVYKVPKRHQKTTKWVIMLLGGAFVGFVYNHPLTLVDVNKLIMGYWPDVYNQLYWYILIFGIIIIFLTTGKNTYCKYICPFGAVQECLGAIGGAKNVHSKKFSRTFSWARRIVVLAAIILASIYRNPGMSSYEVYGTIFNLLGTNFEVFFLSFILIFALFIKRPWCHYLCPIPVIEHYARYAEKKARSFFKGQSKNKLPLPDKS